MKTTPKKKRREPGRPLTEGKALKHSANIRLNDDDYNAFTTDAGELAKKLGIPVSLSMWLRLAGREKIANEAAGIKTAFAGVVETIARGAK